MPTYPATDSHVDQEPEYRCSHCKRLLFANELNRFACFVCEDRAQKNLRALPDLYADLSHALQPSAGIRSGRITGGGKTAPLPVALQPLNLRGPGGMVTLLQDVEDSWRRAQRRSPIAASSITDRMLGQIINSLRMNVMWACENYEAIADDLDTINTLYWQARNAITGKRTTLIPVRCRLLYGDGNECGAQMLVDINRPSAKCQECGTRWGSVQWNALFEATRQDAA